MTGRIVVPGGLHDTAARQIATVPAAGCLTGVRNWEKFMKKLLLATVLAFGVTSIHAPVLAQSMPVDVVVSSSSSSAAPGMVVPILLLVLVLGLVVDSHYPY